MSMKALFALLVFGFLFFGCLGPQTGTQTTGNGTQVTGNSGQGTGGTGSSGQTGGTGNGATNSVTAATYAAAVAAGVPMQCTVTQSGQTTTFSIKGKNMYMTGTSNNEKFEAVVKNDIVYMKMNDDMKQSFTTMGKSCDWLQLSDGSTSGSTGGTSTVSPDDYTAPNVVWSCSPAAFGDEKFAVSGGICKMEDLYAGYDIQ